MNVFRALRDAAPHHLLRGSGYREKFYQAESGSAADQSGLCRWCNGLVLLQKKREEEVYHEAELKAMDELEEMMRSESDCASCACAEECPAPETYAAAKNDAAAAETPEEESDGKPDIEIEIVDGDEETDEDDDEPETAGLED